jgi:hypothetical protein
MTLFYGNWFP